jgi:hypothetical protein
MRLLDKGGLIVRVWAVLVGLLNDGFRKKKVTDLFSRVNHFCDRYLA